MSSELITFIGLGTLVVISFLFVKSRKDILRKKGGDWFVDILSNISHFLILPLLQIQLLTPLYRYAFAGQESSVSFQFYEYLLLYMGIDYLWYWNHRLLHSRTFLWNFHMVHHEPGELDLFATPRNSFWSPFIMVYWWLISLVLYFAEDPASFLLLTSIGLVVNFWGHTHFNFKAKGVVGRLLSIFLITPRDHYWHHSKDNTYCNFGTVFNFWDKLHRTWQYSEEVPRGLGFSLKISNLKKVFYPFGN